MVYYMCIPPTAVPSLQRLICAKSSTGLITAASTSNITVARIKAKVVQAKEAKGIRTSGPEGIVNDGRKERR